ncbi:hypothetical protein NM208_g570 [Fusarium decemcellulare]|uniref:Uncharacterized protein n=2 Tax=Fusarium decemcellulare TaxID=57161 RepID=A0ACC1SZR1_9HYPO|nr:hypothetical protein NM208_g743 [Fusarium decemcellulare]KAJ3549302.1 hypothetical protein NM208_g570 [Fusarium decemcellulare]
MANNVEIETIPNDTVLIAGAGPVGLLLATTLAYYDIKSIVLERNSTTTKWPKMDLTNARSMELMRKLGLADSLRKRGVASHWPYYCIFTSGLHNQDYITRWDLPSVDQYRDKIAQTNDGTLPLEPWQRLSQSIFEDWLRGHCNDNPLISLRYGWKVESAQEFDDDVQAVATEVATGKQTVFKANYVVGCDGASSRVRRSLDIPLIGGPVPMHLLLVHFKSRDLSRLQKQGQFWHLHTFSESGLIGAIVAQDEVDTWTAHFLLPVEADSSAIDPHEAIYTVLGGMGGPFRIDIDEILVQSSYRPNLVVAKSYLSPKRRVFLAGDASHQNIPTGGYGMNMGLADAFSIGWRLAAIIKGYGGSALLDSYEQERRDVAMFSVDRSGFHLSTHMQLANIFKTSGKFIDSDSKEGCETRQKLHEYYQTHDQENKDLGIEMGYIYKSATIIPPTSGSEPEFDPGRYIPSTYPGTRAPHVFLKDGTPVFDHYGKDFTLVDFAGASNQSAELLSTAAGKRGLPLKHCKFIGEDHARKLWEEDLVLIRPDGHVAWRGAEVTSPIEAQEIIEITAGVKASSYGLLKEVDKENELREQRAFASTIGLFTQDESFKLEKAGEIQQ